MTAIPEEIGNLKFLKKLIISKSRIASIPDTMMKLKKIKFFIFARTPLEKSIPNEETFLVAELLENTTIDCPKDWKFEDEECICVNYQYDFMPAGLMTRFISR